ncbi:hypothetical protein ZEAMMB73_Zm00001d011168 [Zea mays]|uniref:Uncharacterized protein n=1 Tax=Zea mays TaxID=4577 RepID=A0A1D6FXL0_MAIZE|nr:hypothetical protein ZEAMMB73_Zm00001d011168 [Zea mays]
MAEFDLGTRYNMSYLRDFTTKFMFIPVLSLKHVEEDLRSLETSLTRGTHTHALAPIVPYSMENSVADAMYNKIIVFVNCFLSNECKKGYQTFQCSQKLFNILAAFELTFRKKNIVYPHDS